MFRPGVAEAVEDLESAIAYGRTLPGVQPGPVLLAGQSRGGFLAMHYAGLKPGEVMGVVNFSGGWYPYGPVTTPYYANAGRSAADKVPQLWLYADNDRLYEEALIREYHQAFAAAGGSARFELLHGVPGDGHLLRLYPDRWRRSRQRVSSLTRVEISLTVRAGFGCCGGSSLRRAAPVKFLVPTTSAKCLSRQTDTALSPVIATVVWVIPSGHTKMKSGFLTTAAVFAAATTLAYRHSGAGRRVRS